MERIKSHIKEKWKETQEQRRAKREQKILEKEEKLRKKQEIEEKNLQIRNYIIKQLQENGMRLGTLRDKYPDHITLGMHWIAVRQNGLALGHVPARHRKFNICWEAVCVQNPLALRYVPEYNKSYDLCWNAVGIDGMALEFVPAFYYKPRLLKRAILSNYRSLQFIAYQNIFHVYIWSYERINYARMAVSINSRALEFCDNKDMDICRFAMLENLDAAPFIPEDIFLTTEFISTVLSCHEKEDLENFILFKDEYLTSRKGRQKILLSIILELINTEGDYYRYLNKIPSVIWHQDMFWKGLIQKDFEKFHRGINKEEPGSLYDLTYEQVSYLWKHKYKNTQWSLAEYTAMRYPASNLLSNIFKHANCTYVTYFYRWEMVICDIDTLEIISAIDHDGMREFNTLFRH